MGLTFIKEQSKHYLDAFIQGGGQQRSLRGGTYNTPGIVGLAKAINLMQTKQEAASTQMQELRDTLEKGLLAIDESIVNGKDMSRLPNTLNMSFKYVDGEHLLLALSRHMAVSNGSACNSAAVNPSHVLTAMGIPSALAFSSIRFSLGQYTTSEDIKKTIEIVSSEVAKLRASNILWERRSV